MLAVLMTTSTASCKAESEHGGRPLVPEFLNDPDGAYSIDDVSAPPLESRFRSAGRAAPSLGFVRGWVWIRLHATVPEENEPWLIDLGYPQIDHVTFYWPAPDGAWAKRVTGDTMPFASREFPHRSFLFSVPTNRPTLALYFRIRTDGPMVLPITLWRERDFFNNAANETFFFGFYYAFLLALAAYNLFLFALIRDRAYLFYVGYLGGFALFQASLSGLAFKYLWPDAPFVANASTFSWLMFSLSCGLFFVRRMTHLAAHYPRVHKVTVVLGLLCLCFIPVSWVGAGVGKPLILGLVGVVLLFLPVPIVLALVRRHRPSRYVAIGYATLVPGGVLLVGRTVGLLPDTFWIEHAIQFGTMLEALLLSFALADRIALLTREKVEAQASRIAAERHALELQRDFSDRLIEVQDFERRRIAVELHDGIGQNLVVLINKLKRLTKRAVAQNDIVPVEEIARGTVQELRGVAHALYPNQLDRLGLRAALGNAIKQTLEPAGIEYRYDLAHIEGALPKPAAIHVYRIVQEALSNVVRHSGASRVSVEVERRANSIVLTIDDDGRGIDGEEGFGLTSMGERARALGGALSVETRSSGGTSIRLTIPVKEAL